jgi:hypothetical protein
MRKGLWSGLQKQFCRVIFFATLVCSARLWSAPLDQWHWRNPLPQGNRLLRIVSANGTSVALGELGTVLTSTDGTNWVTQDSGTTFALHDCAYGSSRYVIVGENGTVLISTNLISWTPQYAGTFYTLNGITYDGSRFVAVGKGNTIITSSDGGETWDSHASGNWELYDVVYAAGTYVAVGGNLATASTVGVGVILTSQDASTWALSTVTDAPFFSVAYGQGTFGTVGGYSTIYGGGSFLWSSTDAINWQPVDNSPGPLTEIAFAQGKWVLGQGNLFDAGPYYLASGGIYSSESLTNLSLVSLSNTGIEGFAVANGKFVAARENGTFLLSEDAVTWTNPAPEPLSLSFRELRYLNGSFVGVGYNILSFSSDGISWTNSPPLSNNLISVTYGNDRYVAGGEYRTIWTSTDGINWTNPAPELGEFPYLADVHVAFGNGVFVGASGYYGDILTSPDGLTWNLQQLTNGYSYNYFEDITFGNGRFVAVTSSLLSMSTDGTNWFSMTTVGLSGVAAGNGKFVAVGPGVIMTSSDGTNWLTQTSSQFAYLTKVAFGGGFFVAVASPWSFSTLHPESTILISNDGVHWTKKRSRTSRRLSTVAFGNGAFVIGGDNSLILQSDPIINLSLSMTGLPQLWIDGPVHHDYRIEYSDSPSASGLWSPLTNITVSVSPTSLTDSTASNRPMRFYRAILLE